MHQECALLSGQQAERIAKKKAEKESKGAADHTDVPVGNPRGRVSCCFHLGACVCMRYIASSRDCEVHGVRTGQCRQHSQSHCIVRLVHSKRIPRKPEYISTVLPMCVLSFEVFPVKRGLLHSAVRFYALYKCLSTIFVHRYFPRPGVPKAKDPKEF